MAAFSGSICVGRGQYAYGDVDDVAVVLEVLRQLGYLRRERAPGSTSRSSGGMLVTLTAQKGTWFSFRQQGTASTLDSISKFRRAFCRGEVSDDMICLTMDSMSCSERAVRRGRPRCRESGFCAS